jgi:DNA-binding HxlR family transcriptional regulator
MPQVRNTYLRGKYKYGIRTCVVSTSTEYLLIEEREVEDHSAMTTQSQFCPVAKAAEVFADRWTPIIIRELCFGTRSFGELLRAAPPISRTMLAQRLKQLEQSGVVYIEPKPSGKGHLYRLTPAGEDFRSIIELLSVWGQRWGQGLLGPDDLDPQELVWSMRRQIDPADIPAQGLVIHFDFRGLPKSNRSPRYWWLVVRADDIEVCLKAPAINTDVVIAADLMTFTKVWLGYVGLAAALESGKVSLNGPARAISVARRLLALPSQPTLKAFKFSSFPASDTFAA